MDDEMADRPKIDPRFLRPEVVALDVIFTPGNAAGYDLGVRDEIHNVDPVPHPFLPLEVHQVGRSCWVPGDTIERPYSSYFAVEFVSAGAGELSVNGSHYTLTAGDVFLLHPNEHQLYRALPDELFEKFFFSLAPGDTISTQTVLRFDLANVTRVHLDAGAAQRVAGAFERMIALVAEQPDGYRGEASRLAYGILVDTAIAAHGSQDHPALPEPLLRAMAHACDHVEQRLSVHDLARVAGYSTDHLNRLMMRHVGLHTHQWLERMKMNKAADLLSQTARRIEDVADAVGYENPYYFSRAFKRITGVAPSVYRRRCSSGPALRTVGPLPGMTGSR